MTTTAAAKAPAKSVLNESKQIERAAMLIGMGARMQVLESETTLSYERLIRLYKEIAGKSPSKGQLPFSTDWFLTWQPNIHSSLFINIHQFLVEHAGATGIQAVMKAYKLYLEQMPPAPNEEPLLSLTRAWTLVRFFNGGMLQLAPCSKCQGKFIVNALDLNSDYLCGLCHMPSRAGKTRKAKEALDQARADEEAEGKAAGLDPA